MKVLKKLFEGYNFLILAGIVFILGLGLHFHGTVHDWPTMLDNYYDVTLSIVKGQGLNKTSLYYECKSLYDGGGELPLECLRISLSRGRDGDFYPTYPPGLSFLAIPYFWIINLFGFGEFVELSSLVLFNVFLSVLLVFAIYKLSNLYTGDKYSKEISLLFGFGTVIFTYSQTFASDILAALLVVSGFYYFLLFLKRHDTNHLLFSGMLTGYLYAAKTVLSFIPLLFFVYVFFKDWKKSYFFLAGFIPVFMIGAAYFFTFFGSPFTTGYSERVMLDWTIRSDLSFVHNPIIGGLVILSGLIFFSPFIIYSLKFLFRDSDLLENRFVFIILIISIFLFGSWQNWFGGWSFGPRLEVYLLCLLCVPLAKNYNIVRNNKWFRILAVISIIITVLGTLNFWFWDVQEQVMIFLRSLVILV